MIEKRKTQIEIESKQGSTPEPKALSDDEGDRSCPFDQAPLEEALPRSQSNIGPIKRFSPTLSPSVSPTRLSILDTEMESLGLTKSELDERCSDLFSEAPIPFI